MTPSQYKITRSVAEAIDKLQDVGALGDSESEDLFNRYLEDIGSSLEDYWNSYDQGFATRFTFTVLKK